MTAECFYLQAEFDYLKSLEIEEKINCLRWCRPLKDPQAEDDGDDNVRGGAPGGGGVLGPISGLWWWSSPAPW